MYSLSHIDQELAKRGINLDKISSSPPPEPAPQEKNININAIDAELARRGVGNTAEKPFSLGQRTGQLFHGMTQAAEAIPGAITGLMSRYSQPGSISAGIEPAELETPEQEQVRQRGAETIENALTTDLASKGIEQLAGRELTPSKEDTTGQFLHTTGAFLLPVPGSGYVKGAKLGVKALGKVLAKEAGTAGGASAALQTPSLSEEGTVGRGVEDIAKMIIGGGAGRTLASKTIARDVEKLASQGRFNKMPKVSPISKAMSLGANPNVEVLNLAQKHGIELPINVGMGSTPLNFASNNYLKSMFTSRVFKDVFKKADEQMIGKVRGAIDSLGTSELKPSEASKEFFNFLKEDEKAFKKQSGILYDEARTSLKPTDAIVPVNTIKSLTDAKKILNRDIQSPATKKVAKVISDLTDTWASSEKISIGKDTIDPNRLSQLLGKNNIKTKPIEISRLDDVRKEINQMIDYDPEVRGMEAFLSRLVKDIEKDIDSSPNLEFVAKRKEANKFFYNNLASRFETDLARAIMHGEAPIETFSKMNSVENINILEKIAGKSEKGKEILDALKKAKLKEIIEKTTTPGGLERGSLSSASFGKLFSKGEGKQELIEKLTGKPVYNDLADIAKISEEFSNSGRELLNTSGTAIASSDISKVENLIKSSFKTLYGGLEGAVGYAAAGLPGAAAGVAMPNILSRLLANPTFVKEARAYAIARSQGKEKYAETLLKRMIKTATPLVKNIATVEISKNAVKIGRRPLTPEEGEKNE